MHSTRPRAFVLTFKPSCSPRIELPPVPGNLKDRSARFGYIIDDAFQRNYYENMGTEDVVEEKDYRNRYTKEAIVRRAIRVAKCTPSILPFKTDKPGEVALLASFGSHNPQYIHRRPPTVEKLAKFKEVLFLNKDPQWYALRMCIVSVSRIAHIAYLHVQRNATQICLFRIVYNKRSSFLS
jgi:hypothetical protein